jgi:UDP-N-acetylmuramoyl-L-alanyl-D-glutamate--2,6-diaminopimelate ligase
VSLLAQTKPSAPQLVTTDLLHMISKQAYSFGKTSSADYYFTVVSHSLSGTLCKFMYKNTHLTVELPLVGEFNVYNALGVFGLAHQLGIDSIPIVKALSTFERVPGRLERYIMPNGAWCYIDYAHNPSSIQSVLSTLRNLTHHLIVVTGAGGDRDKTKRPLMAALAASLADCVIFTSDNPRSEDPQAIVEDMLKGVAQENYFKCTIELDRERAIKQAYACSQPDSIIALLGKGPDHYQQIGDTKFYFNEEEIIKNL